VKGTGCMFAHNPVELQAPPDLRCTKLCKKLVEMGYCDSKDCSYAHHAEELRSTSHKTKTYRSNHVGNAAQSKRSSVQSSHKLQQEEIHEEQKKSDMQTGPAKVCSDEKPAMFMPPGLGLDEEWTSMLPQYPFGLCAGGADWITPVDKPAYVPLPGMFPSAQREFNVDNCIQDLNLPSSKAINSFPHPWDMSNPFSPGGDAKISPADELWQLSRIFSDKAPRSMCTVSASESTLCSFGDRYANEFTQLCH